MRNLRYLIASLLVMVFAPLRSECKSETLENMSVSDTNLIKYKGNYNNINFWSWIDKLDTNHKNIMLEAISVMDNANVDEKIHILGELIEEYPELEELLIMATLDPTQESL